MTTSPPPRRVARVALLTANARGHLGGSGTDAAKISLQEALRCDPDHGPSRIALKVRISADEGLRIEDKDGD